MLAISFLVIFIARAFFFSLLSVKVTILSGFIESVQLVVNVISNGKKILPNAQRNYKKIFTTILELLSSLLLHKYINCVRNTDYHSQKYDEESNTKPVT